MQQASSDMMCVVIWLIVSYFADHITTDPPLFTSTGIQDYCDMLSKQLRTNCLSLMDQDGI